MGTLQQDFKYRHSGDPKDKASMHFGIWNSKITKGEDPGRITFQHSRYQHFGSQKDKGSGVTHREIPK
jgi:hypothetical protein